MNVQDEVTHKLRIKDQIVVELDEKENTTHENKDKIFIAL